MSGQLTINFLNRTLHSKNGTAVYKQLSLRGVVLDNTTKRQTSAARRRMRARRANLDFNTDLISRKKRREVASKLDTLTYNDVKGLVKLWETHVEAVVADKRLEPLFHEKVDLFIRQKLVRILIETIEFHGCVISAVMGNITTKGIVVENSKNVLRIVTLRDKTVKCVKKGTKFSFMIRGKCVQFWGDQLR